MYAAIITLQLRPEQLDGTLELYERSVLPGLKATSGFLGITVLGDRPGGKAYIITHWESEAAAQGYDAQFRANADRFASLLVAAPTREVLPVLLHA